MVAVVRHGRLFSFFFFNDTATTEIYTLSLHDALPISRRSWPARRSRRSQSSPPGQSTWWSPTCACQDRKSTRLNSSHSQISYAVFCLKKKKHADTPYQLEHASTLHARVVRSQPDARLA